MATCPVCHYWQDSDEDYEDICPACESQGWQFDLHGNIYNESWDTDDAEADPDYTDWAESYGKPEDE